jgi:hypothetical protein
MIPLKNALNVTNEIQDAGTVIDPALGLLLGAGMLFLMGAMIFGAFYPFYTRYHFGDRCFEIHILNQVWHQVKYEEIVEVITGTGWQVSRKAHPKFLSFPRTLKYPMHYHPSHWLVVRKVDPSGRSWHYYLTTDDSRDLWENFKSRLPHAKLVDCLAS